MDENKFWLSVVLGMFGILWLGIMGTCLICKSWDKHYIEAGYERSVLPGQNGVWWVKP